MKQWLRAFVSRLRIKALGAALSVVLIACFSSWVGLRYTNTVTTSVTDTTETYLPLLTNAIDASAAMGSLTSKAQALLQSCETADGAHQIVLNGSVSKEFEVIERLTSFLRDVGIREYEVKVTSAKDELVSAFRRLSDICDTQAALQQTFEDRLNHAMGSIASMVSIINSLRSGYEQQMSPNAGAADGSRNAWAMLQSLEVMSARLTEIDNALSRTHSNTLVSNGDRIIGQNREALEGLASAFRTSEPRLGEDGYVVESNQLDQLLDSLFRAIMGPEGIHEVWDRTSLFYSGTIITRMALTRADMALAWAL